jgi:hypothetical protein
VDALVVLPAGLISSVEPAERIMEKLRGAGILLRVIICLLSQSL